VIKAGGMEDCKKCVTPATTTPVEADIDGNLFKEDWEYDSIVGMLMFIASNKRPDTAYAVHKESRYTHGT
jgi:hypothetical protein